MRRRDVKFGSKKNDVDEESGSESIIDEDQDDSSSSQESSPESQLSSQDLEYIQNYLFSQNPFELSS